MANLISVRSNQDFSLNYETNQLIPQTEIIILVEKPSYKVKGQKIIRDTDIEEIRFKCGSNGISSLIGQLKQAQQNIVHFEEMAGPLNNIIVNQPAP